MRWTRRQVIGGAAAGAAGLLGVGRARAQAPGDRRHLIVVAGTGGSSIQDAFWAVRESEAASGQVNAFPDAFVTEHGPFRSVRIPPGVPDGSYPGYTTTGQSEFLERHGQDLLLYAFRSSAVNHLVAQKRVLDGDGALGGRTLMEHVADALGGGLPLPNVSMAPSGFASVGTDDTVSGPSRAIPIRSPWAFPLGLHGHRGLSPAWADEDVARMRSLRDRLEDLGPQLTDRRWDRWARARENGQAFEAAQLIQRVNFLRSSPDWPLEAFGIPVSEQAERLAQTFPRLARDPWEAQAALTYLLIRSNASAVVTMGIPLDAVFESGQVLNPRGGFDASHGDHRLNQAIVWDRYLGVVARLIDLLRETPDPDAPDGEGTLWDRCVLYMPSEFGRTQTRPGKDEPFGTDHAFDGAGMLVSPRVRGGQSWGAVTPEGRIVGFDRRTGRVDTAREGLTEREAVAAVLAALDLPTDGLPDLSVVRRS